MTKQLQELCALRGISGREHAVRDYLIAQIRDYAEYTVDPLGNLLVHKVGKQRAQHKVMLCAHMDEVGMLVTDITDDGFLCFSTVGGIETAVLLGRAVQVGVPGISGVIGVKPIHFLEGKERSALPKQDSLYIDIGAEDRAQAQQYVQVGDMVTLDSVFAPLGTNCVKARALDDRAGCAILLEYIQGDLAYDMDFAFTVQEEVGTRGAGPAAFALQPEYAIVVETTTAADLPGVEGEKRVCTLGKGAVITYMDRGTVYDFTLCNKAFTLAKRHGIAVQHKTLVAGGNDAAAIHRSGGGVKTIAVSIPCRYLHSQSCVLQVADYQNVRTLVRVLSEDLAI